MATTAFDGTPVQTVGDLPAVGSVAPDFSVAGRDLSDVTKEQFAGKRVVLNIFPSLDTGICAASVREFNKRATKLDNTAVVCISADLPFAAERFCVAEGVKNVYTGSVFKSEFGKDYGVELADGPLAGLLARSVVVLDTDGTVLYSEVVPEIKQEPNYDAAEAALA
ncbi:MAG: thiol peroxidase [Ancrocorticia sp.]